MRSSLSARHAGPRTSYASLYPGYPLVNLSSLTKAVNGKLVPVLWQEPGPRTVNEAKAGWDYECGGLGEEEGEPRPRNLSLARLGGPAHHSPGFGSPAVNLPCWTTTQLSVCRLQERIRFGTRKRPTARRSSENCRRFLYLSLPPSRRHAGEERDYLMIC